MQSKLSPKQISDLGREWYHTKIQHELTDEQLGMDLAIEVTTGDYEIGEGSIELSRRLRQRIPDAEIFLMKHGSTVTLRMGFRSTFGNLVGPESD